jgi:FAD/FMN-containing dehydrogenase
VTGHGTCDDGLVIDLRPLDRIEVDPQRRIARVGGGVTWGAVDAATQEHGLAVTGGRVPGTGVAGLTLGSGSGWIERKYGLTCDSLRSCKVVTAAGEVLRASTTEHAELFWGLRGGGGNFGIVTEFEFDLHPVGPMIYGGMLMHPAERGTEILKLLRDFMADASDEVNAAAAFVSAPPEDFVPKPVRGQPVVGIIVSYTGDPAAGEKALAPIVEFGPPAIAMVQPMPAVALQQLLEPGNPEECATTGPRTSSTFPTRRVRSSPAMATRAPRRWHRRSSFPAAGRSRGSPMMPWRLVNAMLRSISTS